MILTGQSVARKFATLPSKRFAILIVALAMMMFTLDANALTFTPSESEWITWSPECRARYVVSAAGRGSIFSGRVSSSEVQFYASRYGKGWGSMHHYCAAKILLNRALAAEEPKWRTHYLNRIIKETDYVNEATPRNERLHADTLILKAQAYHRLDKSDAALSALREAITAHPKYSSPYALASIILRDAGKLADARDVLLDGLAAGAENAAELHYFVGLIYVELGDVKTAQIHAIDASNGGYPLNGLQLAIARHKHQSSD